MSQVKIEKLIFGGAGLGRDGAKVVFVWGALPGEVVEYRVVRGKSKFAEGVVTRVIEKSPERLEPREDHYLSCSPWSVLPLRLENEWKQLVTQETFKKIGKLDMPLSNIASDERDYGYRNKIEYSFTLRANQELGYAFFDRGTHRLVAIDACELADKSINTAAVRVLDWVRTVGLAAQELKSVIFRSNQKGEVIAGLFIKNRQNFSTPLELDRTLVGWHIYFSNPFSPASTPDEVMYSVGQNFLTEKIGENKFAFGLNSFFQVNVPVFARALNDIKKYIPTNAQVVDFYSGVGMIGLSVARESKNVVLVESNDEAVQYAQENITRNQISNAEVVHAEAETALSYITQDAAVIFDPPRAGLHKDVVARVLKELPVRIVYLSCDVGTQARDIGLLSGAYQPIFSHLYNFFPHTPHIESLCVLELRKA